MAHPEPSIIYAGDTLAWTRAYGDVFYYDSDGDIQYCSASTWTLTYYLFNSSNAYNFSASADGDDYAVSVATTTTDDWAAGEYTWTCYVTDGTSRYRIDGGSVEIKADYAAATTGYDARSHAKTVLDAIEAVIEGRASQDQMSYSIAGRTLARTPISDLLTLRSVYKAEYERELAAERIESGLETGKRILVRFT